MEVVIVLKFIVEKRGLCVWRRYDAIDFYIKSINKINKYYKGGINNLGYMVTPTSEIVGKDDSIIARFMKVYSGLPIEERTRVIVVLDNGEPVNWEMAYREIKNSTPLGKKITEKLIKLKII